MKKLKKFLTPGFILLFFGSLALANGFLSWYSVPRESALAALKADLANAKLLVARLHKLPIPDLDEYKDVLPEGISVGFALSVIERAAHEAGIKSISFETQREKLDSNLPTVRQRVEPEEPGGGGGETRSKVPDPSSMSCLLKVHGRFEALLRFLGKIESSELLMQIVSLSAIPSETGVKAEIGLRIFFYPGKAKEKTGG
jgi:hypothetical protein